MTSPGEGKLLWLVCDPIEELMVCAGSSQGAEEA